MSVVVGERLGLSLLGQPEKRLAVRRGGPRGAPARVRLGPRLDTGRSGPWKELDRDPGRRDAEPVEAIQVRLVLGVGSSAILHPDGDVGSCLASFSRVLSLRPGRLYPGHGPPVDDGEGRLEHYRDHRIERHTQVANAFHSGARTIEELRMLVYGRLERDLERAADASIRAHLVHMRKCGDEVSTVAGLDDVTLLPEEA